MYAYFLRLGGIAAAYYGAAKLGLDLAFATRSVTAVWPPTGIALAALVLWGPRMWPGVALGAFLANAWTDVPLGSVLGITTGNTLEAVVGAYLLRRAGFSPRLDRVRDVLSLVVLAGTVSTLVSATIGVTSLLAAGVIESADLWSVWRVWWLGDMGGDLLVAPVLMVAATHWPYRDAPGRGLEAGLLAATVAVVGVLVFREDANLAYLVFPLLVWAVLRFWQPGATLGSLAVATLAVAYTANDSGPFVRGNPDDSLLLAQTYFGVTGITILLLAAVITERRRAEQAVERIATTLQEGLLPASLPEVPGVEVAARFRPAGRQHLVGGDFYDVFAIGQDAWAIVVGDVCGKGPDAAAVTALARYTLRATAMHDPTPARALEHLNQAFRQQRSPREFCTVVYARLQVGDGAARLTVSCGGHPLPLLRRADGSVHTVGRPGVLLGVEPSIELPEDTVELGRDDLLLFYTDGLTEAYAPARSLSPQDVAQLLRRLPGRTAHEVVTAVEGETVNASAEPRDDIAVIAARVL